MADYISKYTGTQIDSLLNTASENKAKLDYTNIAYATCSTDAATAAKVATIVDNDNWELKTGSVIVVKFTYAVPVSATMNINSKGAKSIYHKDEDIEADVINSGDTATFIYDGIKYQLIAVDKTNITYTTTIGTSWTGTEAPYSQIIAVNGITASDKPIVDVVLSGIYAADEATLAEWGKIYRIVAAVNSITVYATESTSVSIPIQLQVVR